MRKSFGRIAFVLQLAQKSIVFYSILANFSHPAYASGHNILPKSTTFYCKHVAFYSILAHGRRLQLILLNLENFQMCSILQHSSSWTTSGVDSFLNQQASECVVFDNVVTHKRPPELRLFESTSFKICYFTAFQLLFLQHSNSQTTSGIDTI